jgi:hypothetical protein
VPIFKTTGKVETKMKHKIDNYDLMWAVCGLYVGLFFGFESERVLSGILFGFSLGYLFAHSFGYKHYFQNE